MPSKNRELTGREKQRIKKLIVSLCANYDREYGCLPLDCGCPMFAVCVSQRADAVKGLQTVRQTVPG